MYRILKTNGEELGLVDAVRYIKVGMSGDYIEADISDATGVAFKGNAYPIMDLLILEVDGGEINNQLVTENGVLKAQVTALTSSNQFLEDCIVEMAGVVYA